MNEVFGMILIFLLFTIIGIMGIIFMLCPYLHGKQIIKIAELELRRQELELKVKKKVKT